MRYVLNACLLVAVAASWAAGQTNIDDSQKFAWSENLGWLNWRDANGGENGVRVRPTFLAGFIWSENTGWISLGSGAPSHRVGHHNDAADSSHFAVNIDPATSDLFGLAWGENIG